MKRRVGMFDSGVGGLTVLRECVLRLPNVRFLYLGDNAHAPYGEKGEEEICARTRAAVLALRRRGADAVVLACNTATAVAADALRAEFSFPVIGTEPAVLPAARAARRVLVLCTPRTAESARLASLIARAGADRRFTVFPAPRLAEAVERALTKGEPLRLAEHLPRGSYDAVVLGCTHYVFFRDEIAAFYGAPAYDGGEGVARRLEWQLFGVGKEDVGMRYHESSELNNRDRGNGYAQKIAKNAVIFLGSSKNTNKCVYKQMFDAKKPYI